MNHFGDVAITLLAVCTVVAVIYFYLAIAQALI